MTDPRSVPELSSQERGRYARHLTLPELGLAGQRRLKAASVLCIGAGGLGSPLLLYLAAAGIGRLGIVDDDRVDLSNLQRQVIHGQAAVGEGKTSSARRRILDLNEHCVVDEHPSRLTPENALSLIGAYDLVPSCADGGVMGVMPGLIGLLQATEVIKVITGLGETLDGRLLLVDSLSMRFRELRLERRPHRPAIEQLVDYEQFCNPERPVEGEESKIVNSISVRELKALLDERADLLLLDVRQQAEADVAVIQGSQLFPLASIESGDAIEAIRSLASGRVVYVHCKLGGRSAKAVDHLTRSGIQAVNVTGGIDAWSQEVDASVPRY